METKAGFFSVHDKLKDVAANPKAKKVYLDCLTAAAERALPEAMVLSGDLEATVAESLSQGMGAMLLGERQDKVLRRMHAALSEIAK